MDFSTIAFELEKILKITNICDRMVALQQFNKQ